MSSTLFRQEALNAQSTRLDGEVIVASGSAITIISVIVSLLLIVASIVLSQSTYATMVEVTGTLQPTGGAIRIVPLQAGVVERVFVREGAIVRAGMPLVQLSIPDISEFGENVSRTLDSLERERAAIADQTKAARARSLDGQQSVSQELLNVRRAIEQVRKKIVVLEAKRKLAAASVARAQALAKGRWITASTLDNAETGLLTIEGDLTAANQQQVDLERELIQLRDRSRQYATDLAVQTSALAAQRAGIEQKSIMAQKGRNVIVPAPVTGRVSALSIHVGQNASPGAAIMILAPSQDKLEAEMYVPSKASGFLAPKQIVNLKLDAFPYQTFGVQRASIHDIAEATFVNSDMPTATVEPGTSFYKARATLASQVVTAYGKPTRLRAGMRFTADIEVRRQSLLRWLLDPIYAVAQR